MAENETSACPESTQGTNENEENSWHEKCDEESQQCASSASSSQHTALVLKAFQCQLCACAYSRRSRLNEHMMKVHGDSQEIVQRFHCPFQCQEKYRTMVELLRHCNREHKENLGMQDLEFDSFTEFRQWKEQEEERTHTTYHTALVLKAFQCQLCACAYSRRSRLNEHMMKVHGDSQEIVQRFHCPFQCQEKYRTMVELLRHCNREHKENLGMQDLEFDSFTEFRQWKEQEEERTHTTYVRENCVYYPKIGKEGIKRYYFVCCRDGNYRGHKLSAVSQKERPHQKSSRKMNGTCISRMYVDLHESKRVTVRYIPTHTGHKPGDSELKFLPLPESTKDEVTLKLAQGIPSKRILQDVRENVGDRHNRQQFGDVVKRRHLITKQDVANLRRKVCDQIFMKHSDDAASVQMMVNELYNEKYNPVLLFKPQHIPAPDYPSLPNDVFVFALQTQWQRELYDKFSQAILCIDSTHGTNPYKFKLVTCIVPDDFGKGQPVAWCITNYETSEVMAMFLESIRARSPSSTVTVLMTDDDDVYYSAARKVFGEGVRHILCRWHVDKAWKQQLRSVKTEFQQDLYQTLSLLASEPDKAVFHDRLSKFLKIWRSKEPSFVTYFERYYANRTEKWARCYRHFIHADTDTNMYLESFHNNLKTHYLNGKVNRRVDYLIHVLLEVEVDYFFNYNQRRVLNGFNPKTLQEEDRHKQGMKIDAQLMQETRKDTWHLPSTINNKGYTITRVLESCSECNTDGIAVCTKRECQFLCWHMYRCDEACYDYNNGHVCRHIHRVHSSITHPCATKTGTSTESTSDLVDLGAEMLQTTTSDAPVHKNDHDVQLRTAKAFLVEIEKELLENSSVIGCHLSHINAHLHNALLACRAAKQTTHNIPSFSNRDFVAPGQKMEHQWRFSSTNKTPGRKRKANTLQHASPEKRKKLLNELDNIHVSSNQDNEVVHNPLPLSSHTTTPPSNFTSGKKTRCGKCLGCTSVCCGVCRFCKDKVSNGGPGKLKKACVKRQCTHIQQSTGLALSATKSSPSNAEESIEAGKTKVKTEILTTALTTNTYTKIGNFKDKPLPVQVLERCNPAATSTTSPTLSIRALLSRQNRKVMPVAGDGNCFFRALAVILYGTQDEHARVRREVVGHIEKNSNRFSAFTSQVKQHVDDMRKSRVWATLVEILAAVGMYGVPLYLYTLTPNRSSYHWQCYSPETHTGITPHTFTHMEVAHPMGMHFDVILDANTGMPSKTPPQLTGKTYVHPGIL